jgi:uncharacterized protein GlcG (DUF336 family)
MKLTLDKANIIADRTLAKAREAKYRPMCVAVLDEGGHLKVLKREDNASILRPQIAIGKAWGAVGMGESSRSLSERLKERPAFLGALNSSLTHHVQALVRETVGKDYVHEKPQALLTQLKTLIPM